MLSSYVRNVSSKQTSGLIIVVIHLLVYLVPQSEGANLRVELTLTLTLGQ